MSTRAREFVEANKISPVIAGRILDARDGGAIYDLENGLSFKLTRDECREVHRITGDIPRWKGVPVRATGAKP